jgi:hypothetical protein
MLMAAEGQRAGGSHRPGRCRARARPAHRDPFGDTDQTPTLGIGSAYAWSGVGNLDDHGPVSPLDLHRRRAGGRVLEGVGEGLLDDPVRREVQIARQAQPWVNRQPGVDTGVLEPSDEVG